MTPPSTPLVESLCRRLPATYLGIGTVAVTEQLQAAGNAPSPAALLAAAVVVVVLTGLLGRRAGRLAA